MKYPDGMRRVAPIARELARWELRRKDGTLIGTILKRGLDQFCALRSGAPETVHTSLGAAMSAIFAIDRAELSRNAARPAA
jgi:hypothetical protein